MSNIPSASYQKMSACSFVNGEDRSYTKEQSPNREHENLLPIIAFCHLQWDWVWQRPQQFLSRLAKKRKVLFVETHRSDIVQSFAKIKEYEKTFQVTVMEIHLPKNRWDDGDYIDYERRRVLQEYLEMECMKCFSGAVLWFNDPMAATAYAGHMGESLIVYDCMDELTQFRGAPPQLAEREKNLTCQADLIFCGGRKMRDKRISINANTHFYGTGVDCNHFGTALLDDTPIDEEIAAMPRPVLGYFGVIDERIDYELIEALSDATPQGSVAMVGPFAKIDQNELPRRKNLYWLGPRPYERLPAITKGLSVCLMPFALNASTEYINPTKALEYLAAGRPVVSTALDEVQMNCADVVRIGRNKREFVEIALQEAVCPSSDRIAAGLSLAARNGWDVIADSLSDHIESALKSKKHNKQSSMKKVSLNKQVSIIENIYV